LAAHGWRHAQYPERYAKPINFEEAPYESSVDLKSIPVRQDDGSVKALLATPIVDFSVTLAQADSTAYNAAQSVVAWYTSSGLPGVYRVVQSGAQVSVVPQQVRGSNGNMREVTPVMDSLVAFPLATRPVVETLRLVAASVSAQSRRKVILLNVPFHLTDTVTMGATGESARDVVANLGRIFGVALASQCLYDATARAYYLNVQSIFSPNARGVPPPPGFHGVWAQRFRM
jgi:hypothetical protein